MRDLVRAASAHRVDHQLRIEDHCCRTHATRSAAWYLLLVLVQLVGPVMVKCKRGIDTPELGVDHIKPVSEMYPSRGPMV